MGLLAQVKQIIKQTVGFQGTSSGGWTSISQPRTHLDILGIQVAQESTHSGVRTEVLQGPFTTGLGTLLETRNARAGSVSRACAAQVHEFKSPELT